MRRTLMVFCVGLAACSGTTTGTDHPAPVVGSGHGTCIARKGTFTADSTLRDGSCGPIHERLIMVDQTAAPAKPTGDAGTACTGSATQTDDNCEVTYMQHCPGMGTDTGVTITGVSKWTVDGTYGTGVEQWAINGAAPCVATYDLVYRRQ